MAKTSSIKENKPAIPKEDAALYRLFALIAFAIAGFAGLVAIGKNEGKCWDLFANGWFKAAMLLLFAASLFFVARGFVKGRNENKIFSLSGICAFAAPLFLLFAAYTEMTNASVKFKVALVAVVFIAFIANIYPKNYMRFSIITLLCAVFMYYLNTPWNIITGRLFDQILKAASYPLAFLIPAALIIMLVGTEKSDGVFRIKDKKIFVVSDRTVYYAMIAFLAAEIVFSAIILVTPAAFLPLMIAYGVIYLVIGIICTIKIL